MDALRNWDYQYDYNYYRGGYNNIVSVEVIEDVATEPVTLQEIKMHLQVDYSDKDTILTRLGKAARIQIEKETGVALAPKTIKVEVRNDLGNVQLPYWTPGAEINEVTDADAATVNENNYTITNGVLETTFYNNVFVEYTTGYETCPEDYKQMILERVAWLDENRGDTEKVNNRKVWLL